MADSTKPIILFTNDDGIRSPGLWAAVFAFRDLGRLLVAAPRERQSGMAKGQFRQMPLDQSEVLNSQRRGFGQFK